MPTSIVDILGEIIEVSYLYINLTEEKCGYKISLNGKIISVQIKLSFTY